MATKEEKRRRHDKKLRRKKRMKKERKKYKQRKEQEKVENESILAMLVKAAREKNLPLFEVNQVKDYQYLYDH